MSLRKTAYLYSVLPLCLLTCDWAQVNERVSKAEEGNRRGRECMRVSEAESNALQQRTVTDQAFIWAETAAGCGRKNAATQSTAQSISASATAGDKVDTKRQRYRECTQNLSIATRYMISGILWLLQLCLTATPSPPSPDTLLPICHFLCLDLMGYLCQRNSMAWMRISAGLTSGQTLVAAEDSRDILNILQISWVLIHALLGFIFFCPLERSHRSYWCCGAKMTSWEKLGQEKS